MTFIDWDQYARLGVFGGIFLVALFAVLWLWYDTGGRQVAGLWTSRARGGIAGLAPVSYAGCTSLRGVAGGG